MTATLPIADIVRRVDPSLRIVKHWTLGGGQSSDMTAVEVASTGGGSQRLVIRRPRAGAYMANPRRIAHEFRALSRLAEARISAPKPVFVDPRPDDRSADYMVISFVDGAPDFAPADTTAFINAVAAALADIHRIDGGDDQDLALLDHTETASKYLGMSVDGLDETLEITRIVHALRAVWPPPVSRKSLLHGDYWPGNILWQDETISAVVDWESASVGNPLADVAVMRLNLLWMLDREAMEVFTLSYAERSGVDLVCLPCWDLVAALRPAAGIAAWAAGWSVAGRPDITEDKMRADHQTFRTSALSKIEA